MRKVNLRMKEQNKYEKIKKLVEKDTNKNKVCIELGLSKRQVNRLVIKYKEKGKSAFIHGNRSKQPTNTLDKSLSDTIILLYTTKYQDFNFNHFKDMLKEKENIVVSYTLIYNLLMKNDLLSPKIRKKTRKRIMKEKLKLTTKKKTNNELDVMVNHQIDLEDAHPRRERSKYFGEEIQMDASQHLWFGNHKCYLHLAIDDATGNIIGAFFDKEETLFGYYNVFKQILLNYGIPNKFKTDNRTIFNYISSKIKTSEKDVLTQFGYACKTFGVEIETTSVSQAKGRIERANGTFQGRLINELKIEGINTIEEANMYLINIFVPSFNKRFGLNYKKFESVFEEKPDLKMINYTLAILTPRLIDNGNTIKYKNEYYQPYLKNEIKCFMPKTEVLVIKAFDGQLLVSIDDNVYELKKLETHLKTSPTFDIDIKEAAIPERKKYIPPMTHPWKVKSFKKQIQRSHSKHIFT